MPQFDSNDDVLTTTDDVAATTIGPKSIADARKAFDDLLTAVQQLADKVPLVSRVIPVAPNQPAVVNAPPAGDDQVTKNGLTVREYARLAAHCYKLCVGEKEMIATPVDGFTWLPAPDGWTLVRGDPFNESGYASGEYIDGNGNYVCAFRGTDGPGDWATNFIQGIGLAADQYIKAHNLAHDLAWRFQNGQLYGGTPSSSSAKKATSLTFTGHSLGGGLAGAAWSLTGYPTVTFNAAGVSIGTRIRDYFRSKDEQIDRDLGMTGIQAIVSPNGPCTNYHVYREVLSTGQWVFSGEWVTKIAPELKKFEEAARIAPLISHAAGHQVMLQRPDRRKVYAPDPPPDFSDQTAPEILLLPISYAIELHLMISVIPALELPPFSSDKDDPF